MDNQRNIFINPVPSKTLFTQNELKSEEIEEQKLNQKSKRILRQNKNLNLNKEQLVLDLEPESQVQINEEPNPNFNVPIKNSNRRKKIIIFAVIIAAALLITGGVLIYHFASQTTSTDDNKIIQLPKDYEKHKETIQKGQENNLVEIIYVPKSQKIYEYTMYNNQYTVSGDDKVKESSSKIVHTLGLLCTGISETEFQMVLYLMDTKTYDNNQLISTISGFPDMLSKENKKLRMMEEVAQQNNPSGQQSDVVDEISQKSEGNIMNEYAPLTSDEIELLKQKGISQQQFSFSHYPIIKFSILKDGKLNMIEQPINLRNDFYAIYLNVLEQMSPLVAKDAYNLKSIDGKRILSSNGGKLKGRSLANEEVEKELTAQELDNGDMSFNQKFENNKKPSETSAQNTSYDQSSTIQNGALLESKVKSGVSMTDNKSSSDSEDQNGMPLMKKIEVKSEGLIKFVKQEDNVNDNLYNSIIEYQGEMSVIKQNYSQALELYNSVFNTNNSDGEARVEQDPEDQNKPNGRMLQKDNGKDMNPPIQKPIFRKSFASLEFGADIKSECKQFKGTATKDLCKVGLYSYFNGATIKLAEKETRINVSKILKYYQLIQNFVQTKLTGIKDDVLGNLTKIKEDLDGILDKLEELIDVKRNPILKEVYEIVYNDELQVFTLINTFETFMNKAVSTVSNIVADPFQAIKEQTLSFITLKQNSIESSANSIQDFYISKLTLIQTTVNSQKSINQEDYDDIKSIIDNIEDLLTILVEQPAKKVFDELEEYVLEQSNKVFGETNTMEKTIDVPKDDSKVDGDDNTKQSEDSDNKKSDSDAKSEKKPNFLKRVLGTSAFVETLQKYLLKVMNKISEVSNFSAIATLDLKKNVLKLAQEVLADIEKLPKTSSERSQAIVSSLDEFENVFNYSLDLSAGLVEVKDEIDKIFETITIIQSKSTSKIVENIAENLTGFPVQLLSKLKTQGQATVQKFKDVSVNMKTNLTKWKDELVGHSKKLKEDAKNLYEGLQKLFGKVEFDENDPDQYKKPLFDEVEDVAGTVNEILAFNAGGIVETAKRFAQIPNKFKVFLSDFKDLSSRTFNYFKDIGLSFSNIYFDQKDLWSNFGQKPQTQAQVYNNQLSSSYEKDVNVGINQQALPDLNNQASNMANKDLSEYQTSIVDNNKKTTDRAKELIFDLIKQAEFEGRIESPPMVIPYEYSYVYPTPIGILLKMRLYASWSASLFFDIKVKNAVLDLGAGVSTKVVVGGEVSASAVVVEVGGYAEGTFLNTELKVGLNLKVLQNFKGNIYLDVKFVPYTIKMGLFYKTVFQIENVTCNMQDERRRQLGLFSWAKSAVKSVVKSVVKAAEVVVKVIKKVLKCITSLQIQFKRNDIFDPIELKGTTYSTRLFQVDF